MPASQFYLGRWAADGAGPTPVHYDPADLTTHAVVIGMTGSGKTGLLISLLEEAARQGHRHALPPSAAPRPRPAAAPFTRANPLRITRG